MHCNILAPKTSPFIKRTILAQIGGIVGYCELEAMFPNVGEVKIISFTTFLMGDKGCHCFVLFVLFSKANFLYVALTVLELAL